MKKIITTFLSCLFSLFIIAQQSDSIVNNTGCDLRISLLTCSPGAELYSTFGHSALRVVDPSTNTDIIYNYGTFDFDDPDFYSKFTRGKLLYFVSIDRFENFLYQYQYEQRGITEQVLNLSCPEKEKLFAALKENAKEENKYYKYDFVYDNCTTRLRDIVLSGDNRKIEVKDVRSKDNVTFRNLIHEYLNKSHQYWSKLGIDILLGSPLDKHISNSEAMFLPDYLLKGFDSTTIDNKLLVSEKQEILKATAIPEKKPFFTPFILFTILFLAIVVLSFYGAARKFLNAFDVLLYFLTGSLGILLLFMWFGTDHQTCKNNFNLLWAFPPNLFISFFLFKKWKWVKYNFLINIILLTLLLILWKWLPQEMNNALLPVVALLLFRNFIRFKKLSYAG